MEPGEYEGMVAKARKDRSFQSASELLQFVRTHKVHQPEVVIELGGKLLNEYPRKLGNELWTVMEQVFLAACIVGHDEWREYCIRKLMHQWPNSHRVERLKGMHSESKGDYDEATKIYTKIIADKPEDTITRKRMIAMYKQRGNTEKAITEINAYLDTFSTDSEVWHELAELYIEAGSLTRAQYCFEELMLSNPRSLYHILTYAELLYSVNEHELSRKYFSLACYLDGACLRALWGLLAVGMAQAEKDKNNREDKNEKLEKLHKFCNERLVKLYTENAKTASHGKVAIAMLKDVGAS